LRHVFRYVFWERGIIASILIWFVRLISNRSNPALILWLRVLLLGDTYGGRSGICSCSHGGGSNSIIVFYVWQSWDGEMDAGLLLVGSLAGAKYQPSRWACRKISVFWRWADF